MAKPQTKPRTTKPVVLSSYTYRRLLVVCTELARALAYHGYLELAKPLHRIADPTKPVTRRWVQRIQKRTFAANTYLANLAPMECGNPLTNMMLTNSAGNLVEALHSILGRGKTFTEEEDIQRTIRCLNRASDHACDASSQPPLSQSQSKRKRACQK